MNPTATGSARSVTKSLWSRAPLWRSALVSAILFTLLFILFPPEPRRAKEPGAQDAPSQVSYVFQRTARANPTPSLPADKPSSQTAAPTISGVTKTAPLQPFTHANPPPKTADLSLAAPGGVDAVEQETGVNAAMLGRLYNGSVTMNGFKITLPEGNWAMLANTKTTLKTDPNGRGGGYFLGRIEHKRLSGVVVVDSIKTETANLQELVKTHPCDLSNPLWKSDDPSDSGNFQSCWIIHPVFTPPWQQWADRGIALNNLDRAAAGDMTAKGVTYPQDLIAVQFVIMNTHKVITVSYMFNPERDGLTSAVAPSVMDSDWAPQNINRFPEKIVYVDKLKAWASSVWPQFKAAFAEGD